jgi:hypothetical protein
VLLFDREGYSPAFFKEMWQEHRIACTTYHKFPKKDWPESAFCDTEVVLADGQSVVMKLAERGSLIGRQVDEQLWVREVRKLTESGHQTSLISTFYGGNALHDAGCLFSRWSQENFFQYAMKHYGIDLLSEYGTDGCPAPKRDVVNPARRELDTRRRSLQSRLTRKRAEYAAGTMHPQADEKKISQWEKRQAKLVEAIEHLEHELEEVKQLQSETPSHIPWNELPEDAQFKQLGFLNVLAVSRWVVNDEAPTRIIPRAFGGCDRRRELQSVSESFPSANREALHTATGRAPSEAEFQRRVFGLLETSQHRLRPKICI